MERHPDIEIYVKRVPLPDLIQWLEQQFDIGEQSRVGDTLKLQMTYDGKPLNCTIFENAAKGGYTSVTFEPNHTPWDTDEACAEEAFDAFRLEVRCISGGWDGEPETEGGWYRFTENGRSMVNWLT